MKKRVLLRAAAAFLSAILLFTAGCSLQDPAGGIPTKKSTEQKTAAPTPDGESNPHASVPDTAGSTEQTEEIRVAGVSLMTNTVYTVLLEAAENCTPRDFTPVYVEMVFESANYGHVSYDGKTIDFGCNSNDKYLDMFSMSQAPDEQFALNGKWDADTPHADFVVHVTTFVQGPDSLSVFGQTPEEPDPGIIQDPEPEPVIFTLGKQSVRQRETYKYRFVSGEDCDVLFEPFVVPIEILSDRCVSIVTGQYKNISYVYPAGLYMEESGWMELSSNSGKVWGQIEAGSEGADLTFVVTGLEKNLARLFTVTGTRPDPEPPTQAPTQAPTQPQTQPEPEPVKPNDYDTRLYYHYGLLSDDEKIVYTQMSEALNNCVESVDLARFVSNDRINEIFWCILYDQPQIFWTNRKYSVSYTGGKVSSVRFYYNELAENLAAEKARVEAEVQKILKAVSGMNILEAERYIHDYIIEETVYVSNSPYNQNLYSTLVNHETVCAGYARAFQYLMHRLDAACYYCHGMAGSGNDRGRHAWNVVELNGNWYNIDLTWDDQYGEKNRTISYISYEYYNVTDAFMSASRNRIDQSLELPPCNDTKESVQSLYGHSWQVETAIEAGWPVINTLDEYFRFCYDTMNSKLNGVGSVTASFLIANEETMQRLRSQPETKEYAEGYWYPLVRAKGFNGLYYSYRYVYWPLGNGSYYVEITHTLRKQ